MNCKHKECDFRQPECTVKNCYIPDVSESPRTLGYSFWFDWSNDDQEWAARCDQFPLTSCLDKNKGKAMASLMRIIADEIDE